MSFEYVLNIVKYIFNIMDFGLIMYVLNLAQTVEMRKLFKVTS